MALLIDGYNLLNATGIFATGRGSHTLERSRRALLNFLANHVADDELPHTTVVFDAKDAPPGLPRTLKHHGMTVLYAAHHAEADDLIEELIRADSAPRQLTVVSSDHRLQRATRRRRATAVDSDVWYANLVDQEKNVQQHGESVKPKLPLSPDEVDAWVEKFADIEAELQNPWLPDEAPPATDVPPEPATKEAVTYDALGNPFPPGYAEDLLDEENELLEP